MSKFKVGDRVVCYNTERCKAIRFVGHVSVVGNNNEVIGGDGLMLIIGDDGFSDFFQPQQCRKLVKKKKSNEFICSWCGSREGHPLALLRDPPIPCCTICSGLAQNKFKCEKCGSDFVSHVCNNDKIIFREYNPKFKVGDFVKHKDNRFILGQILDIQIVHNYPIYAIVRGFDDKKCLEIFSYCTEESLQKLNIKFEE